MLAEPCTSLAKPDRPSLVDDSFFFICALAPAFVYQKYHAPLMEIKEFYSRMDPDFDRY